MTSFYEKERVYLNGLKPMFASFGQKWVLLQLDSIISVVILDYLVCVGTCPDKVLMFLETNKHFKFLCLYACVRVCMSCNFIFYIFNRVKLLVSIPDSASDSTWSAPDQGCSQTNKSCTAYVAKSVWRQLSLFCYVFCSWRLLPILLIKLGQHLHSYT